MIGCGVGLGSGMLSSAGIDLKGAYAAVDGFSLSGKGACGLV